MDSYAEIYLNFKDSEETLKDYETHFDEIR